MRCRRGGVTLGGTMDHHWLFMQRELRHNLSLVDFIHDTNRGRAIDFRIFLTASAARSPLVAFSSGRDGVERRLTRTFLLRRVSAGVCYANGSLSYSVKSFVS